MAALPTETRMIFLYALQLDLKCKSNSPRIQDIAIALCHMFCLQNEVKNKQKCDILQAGWAPNAFSVAAQRAKRPAPPQHLHLQPGEMNKWPMEQPSGWIGWTENSFCNSSRIQSWGHFTSCKHTSWWNFVQLGADKTQAHLGRGYTWSHQQCHPTKQLHSSNSPQFFSSLPGGLAYGPGAWKNLEPSQDKTHRENGEKQHNLSRCHPQWVVVLCQKCLSERSRAWTFEALSLPMKWIPFKHQMPWNVPQSPWKQFSSELQRYTKMLF